MSIVMIAGSLGNVFFVMIVAQLFGPRKGTASLTAFLCTLPALCRLRSLLGRLFLLLGLQPLLVGLVGLLRALRAS